jgi:hypothetical protein
MGKGREPIMKPRYIFTNPIFERDGDNASLKFKYNTENGERKEQQVCLAVVNGRIQMVEQVSVMV